MMFYHLLIMVTYFMGQIQEDGLRPISYLALLKREFNDDKITGRQKVSADSTWFLQIMAGMQFEYDEEGGTFFYFLLSFWGLVLIPCTYYFWPRKQESGKYFPNTETEDSPPSRKSQNNVFCFHFLLLHLLRGSWNLI